MSFAEGEDQEEYDDEEDEDTMQTYSAARLEGWSCVRGLRLLSHNNNNDDGWYDQQPHNT